MNDLVVVDDVKYAIAPSAGLEIPFLWGAAKCYEIYTSCSEALSEPLNQFTMTATVDLVAVMMVNML